MPWPDAAAQAKLDAAARQGVAREADYEAARAHASGRANEAARKLAASGRDAVAHALRGSVAVGLAAYYPFESARPAKLTDLPPLRPWWGKR